jgi:2,3-bisphosphoglycerate-dependent phosphoglycerate mutase
MAVLTELLLARHGQATCNLTGLVGGPRTCTGLTDTGRDHVRHLARRLRADSRPIDVLYAAPRRRCQETGRILADTLDLPLHTEPGLDGPRHGQADGQPWHEVKAAFGGPPQARPDQPYAAGAETWNDYLNRATAFLATLFDRHPGERILLACHGETIHAAHTLLLDLPRTPPAHAAGFVTDHAALTIWQQHRNRYGRTLWLLATHNDTTHLTAKP